MGSEYVLPDSVHDVWSFAKSHLANREGAHLDAILQQIGDDTITARPLPKAKDGESELDRTVYQLWQKAGPSERHRLAALFMRTVGHATFLEDERYSGESELQEWR